MRPTWRGYSRLTPPCEAGTIREEPLMYIGVGTLLVVVIILLLILLL